MTGTTSPLGFPYLTAGDSLASLPTVMQQLAEAVDDYLAALSSIAPVNWTSLTTAGWGGTVQYARRAGMVTVNLEVTLAAFNPGDGIATLPAGFRPSRTIRGVGQYGVSGANQPRPFVVNSAGLIAIDGTGTQTGGVYGSIAFPV